MVAITHGNHYNARIWSDIMNTDNSYIYIYSQLMEMGNVEYKSYNMMIPFVI